MSDSAMSRRAPSHFLLLGAYLASAAPARMRWPAVASLRLITDHKLSTMSFLPSMMYAA